MLEGRIEGLRFVKREAMEWQELAARLASGLLSDIGGKVRDGWVVVERA